MERERIDPLFALDGHPIAGDWALPEAPHVVAWSGTFADELFETHPHNWLSRGRQTLDAWCEGQRDALNAAGRRVTFLPHARHVLSDAPACRAFVEEHGAGPFGVALAPALLFEESMWPDVEDHLVRILELVGPRCDVVMAGGDDRLPDSLLAELIERCVPSSTPIAMLPA